MVDIKAPNGANNTQDSSSRWVSPIGLFYRSTSTDNSAFGAGIYTAGGNATEFNEVQYPGYTARPNIYTKLAINELAIGAGYKVNEKLRVGMAWRGWLHASLTWPVPA